jgi:hypothetical protein
MTANVISRPATRFGRNSTAQAANGQTPRGPAPPPTKFGVVANVQNKPAPAWIRDATVQLARRKKGVAGGGGGLGYGDVGRDLTEERKNKVMAEAGLTKIKGHGLGGSG